MKQAALLVGLVLIGLTLIMLGILASAAWGQDLIATILIGFGIGTSLIAAAAVVQISLRD